MHTRHNVRGHCCCTISRLGGSAMGLLPLDQFIKAMRHSCPRLSKPGLSTTQPAMVQLRRSPQQARRSPICSNAGTTCLGAAQQEQLSNLAAKHFAGQRCRRQQQQHIHSTRQSSATSSQAWCGAGASHLQVGLRQYAENAAEPLIEERLCLHGQKVSSKGPCGPALSTHGTGLGQRCRPLADGLHGKATGASQDLPAA